MPIKVGTDDALVSRSGRLLSSVPAINLASSRRCTNSLRRLETWLLQEARAEAYACEDAWGKLLMRQMTVKALSQSDRDHLNLYLFGNAEGASAANVRRNIHAGLTAALQPA